MNRRPLFAISLTVALMLSGVAVRRARADLDQDQWEVLALEYLDLLYELDSLEWQLDEKNGQVAQWESSVNAMESSTAGLTLLLVYTYPTLTYAEIDSINAQLDVLYIQIPHARNQLDSYKSERDAIQTEIFGVTVAMALIEQFLAGR